MGVSDTMTLNSWGRTPSTVTASLDVFMDDALYPISFS